MLLETQTRVEMHFELFYHKYNNLALKSAVKILLLRTHQCSIQVNSKLCKLNSISFLAQSKHTFLRSYILVECAENCTVLIVIIYM